jgi:hypothetical protein
MTEEEKMPSYRLIAAGLALLLYFVVAGVILFRILGNQGALVPGTWEQVIVVFNAVGAIATTAAGVLLGVEIQQASVQQSQRAARDLSARLAGNQAAAMTALDHLDSGNDGVSAARSALRRTLGPQC